MALTVVFVGRVALPTPGSGLSYRIWSYRIEPSGTGELQPGHRIALGLPSDVDVRDPDAFPGVPQLVGTFVQRDPTSSRQFVGRVITSAGGQTVSFVAPAAEATYELMLIRSVPGQQAVVVPFATSTGSTPGHLQVLPAPVPGPPVFTGRPLADFVGARPYASELFGVYQPLVGWFGMQNTMWATSGSTRSELARLDRGAFLGQRARTLDDEALAGLMERYEAPVRGVLSPIGLMNLFREYFFEFDSFLGVPVEHVWVSPGGTVEVVETTTRRTLTEKVAEQAEETSRKVEESLTEQDDVADAVKEENANDTKLGVSATGGVNAGIYHGEASASFSTQDTVKRSSEETHKHVRTQTAKVTSEIKRNFKTTFKTVTETTDTSSRRYVLQNTGDELVNYELRRKMRKVGVQVQHIGTRLSWQVYLDNPGRDLGLGDMVNVVPASDLTAIPKPERLPLPEAKQVPFHDVVPFVHDRGPDDEATETYVPIPENPRRGRSEHWPEHDDTIQFWFEYRLPPKPPGYELSDVASIDLHGAQVQYTYRNHLAVENPNPNPTANTFQLLLTHANFQGRKSLPFDVVFIYVPTEDTIKAVAAANAAAEAAYNKQVEQLQREAYGNAVRERLQAVSSMRPRPSTALRSEERQTVYGYLIRRLMSIFEDPHIGSELIRQVFDVDEMLYFVAPDFWRPHTSQPPPAMPPSEQAHATKCSVGPYPVPGPSGEPDPQALAGQTVTSWYSRTARNYTGDLEQPNAEAATPIPCPPAIEEWRVNYLITEKTQPAPMGSSLGWLIQIDGDQRRNEFLNAAWAKAVLPVRPGRELDALWWLTRIEGETALGLDYPFDPEVDPPEYEGLKVGEVLEKLATALQKSNTDIANTLASEEVFETGFDPLSGGFRPAEPYQVFDQWVEVLPTDQVVALAVRYDPRTGQQQA
jgi:hypothetical protein